MIAFINKILLFSHGTVLERQRKMRPRLNFAGLTVGAETQGSAVFRNKPGRQLRISLPGWEARMGIICSLALWHRGL